MSKFLCHALALVSALVLSLPMAARAGTIDGFTTAFSGGTLSATGTASQTSITSNPIRNATLTGSDSTNLVTATINTTTHQMGYTTRDLKTSGKLILNYGVNNPLKLNLTADGSNRFQISIPSSSLGTSKLPVTINLFCVATDGVTQQSAPAKTYNLVTGTNLIRFSDFSASCNLQNVSQIAYTFNASALNRLNYTLNPLKTVYSAY